MITSCFVFLLIITSLFGNGEMQTLANEEDVRENLALHKVVTVSGLEVNDGRFTADKAVDGIVSDTSRVSFSKAADEQWMLIDMEETKTISEIVINYESQVPSFRIEVSQDGTKYEEVYNKTDGANGGKGVLTCSFDATSARFVRYVQQKRWYNSGNKQYYSGSIYELEVYEENGEVELPVNLALNKSASASGLEVNDGRFTADKAVDGLVNKDSRISFAKDEDEQWLLIDLEKIQTVSYVVMNYESQVTNFKIQVSENGSDFIDVYEKQDGVNGTSGIVNCRFTPIKARYIRYVQLKRWLHTNGQYYSGSIYEFEVYKEAPVSVKTSQDVLDTINGKAPTISDDGTHVVLPEVDDGFAISLYGSDNQQVVKLDTTLIKPVINMDVNVLYKVENKNDKEDVATSSKDIKLHVTGSYQQETGDNEKPNVMPGLREWKGSQGAFVMDDDTRIVYHDDSSKATAETIQFYFEEMLNQQISIVNDEARNGDIELVLNNDQSLGEEGYTLDIKDIVQITAPTQKGLLYGGISFTQIAYQSNDQRSVVKGFARDYPKYEVRAGMIDVGRMYIPLDYLEELSIYMSWFKLNEVQVHINDYWAGSGYTAFRLESEVYPMIMAKDGTYSKEDYRQYQKDMKRYGIDVITEMDTPYHAECFRNVPGVKMLKAGALDIREQSTYTIVENIMSEYLDGDDPIIQSDNFHIGTDEYDKAYSEQMRAYTDHFIKFVNDKGYNTRLWGSLGSRGFKGTTPVTTDATINLWAPYWADVKETYEDGWNVINTCGGWLYIVPGGNAGYPDRMDIKSLYQSFDVNNFAPSRNYGQGTAIMPVAHPQTKGAEFALWNDVTTYRGGFSAFDIYDRVKEAVMITSEKTWYGEQTEGQSADQFIDRVAQLQDEVPGCNPARRVDSDTALVAAYDFAEEANDYSNNGYDATIVQGSIVEAESDMALSLAGDGYLTLPFTSLGYPYTLHMDVYVEEINDKATLFTGADGTFYTNINNSGKLGFTRGDYQFVFDYALPEKTWISLDITSDQKNTSLYVDGKYIGTANNMEKSTRKDSSTSVLPTEKIGEGFNGKLKNLKLYNEVHVSNQKKIDHSLMQASATSSLNNDRTPDKAIDDVESTSWSADFNNEHLPQSLTLTLDQTYCISTLEYFPKRTYADGQITTYKLEVSLDGKEYTDIASGNWAENFDLKTVTFAPVDAKYVRLTALEGKNNQAAISELNIYEAGADASTLSTYVLELQQLLNTKEDQYTQQSVSELRQTIKQAKQTIALANDQAQLNDMYEQVSKTYDALISTVELQNIVEKANALQADDYTQESYEVLQDVLLKVINLYVDGTQSSIAQAVMDVQAAMDQLIIRCNVTFLQMMIGICDQVFNNTTIYNTTLESWNIFDDVYQKAKQLAEKPTTQEAVDDMVKQLSAAYEDLRLLPTEDVLRDLEIFIQLTNTLDFRLYTSSDFAQIMQIRSKVEELCKSQNMTKQQYMQALQQIEEANFIMVHGKQVVEGGNPIQDSDVQETVTLETRKQVGSPKTGDAQYPWTFAGICMVSMCALYILRLKKEHHN